MAGEAGWNLFNSSVLPQDLLKNVVEKLNADEDDPCHILAGLNAQTLTHPELLYVGASRARAALYAFSLVPLL